MDPRRTLKPPVKPLQLISFDPDKKLVVSQEAIDLFKNMESDQLHIITVAGKYRTGKSYILNRVLLERNSGFEVGPTINACTKGLWMWPEIVKVESEGKVKDCIIIDTEGLGSLEEGENTDIKIFLMAVLLSSYLIYNSVGSIDEKAIESLSLVINLAEMLHKENNQYDSHELINSFPSFMWLVRDFSLRLENEVGEPITSTEYLETALKYQRTATKAAERKNLIRKKLKTFFQDRDCFTLVRPTENERDLQNLSSINERLLRPEFVKLIQQFKQTIRSNLKAKKVRGKTVTPQGFIQLCKYFVNTINEGKLPSINSHWDSLCVKESTRIIDHYVKDHQRSLQEAAGGVNEAEDKLKAIADRHKQLLVQAEGKIDKSFLGKLQKQLSKERMEKLLGEVYREVVKSINDKRYAVVKGIVDEIFVEIMKEFEEKKLESFEEIFARFEEIKEKYKHDDGIYQSFYENSKDVFQEFVRNLKDYWEREHSVLNEKNLYLEAAISEKTNLMKQKLNESDEAVRLAEQKLYKYELQNTQLTEANGLLKQQCESLLQENQRLAQEREELSEFNRQSALEQLEEVKSRLNAEVNSANREIHRLSIEVIKLEEQAKQYLIKERKSQREMEIFKNKCSEYLKENIALAEVVENLKKKRLESDKQRRKTGLNINGDTPTIIIELSNKIDTLELNLQMKEDENLNLMRTINSQKQTQDTLLRAPQNLNYALMKKNYEQEVENSKRLADKVKEYELITSLCSFKCQICKQSVDRTRLKSHVKLCSETKDFHADVSYEYNGRGEVQFVVDVQVAEQAWTIPKTIHNIKHFLKKMGLSSEIFEQLDPFSQDINPIEECRLFLDELFNEKREDIWGSSYLIEFFGVDIHFLNQRKSECGSMRGSKVSVDLEALEENFNPGPNLLMKTTKFSRKCFNFGPHVL